MSEGMEINKEMRNRVLEAILCDTRPGRCGRGGGCGLLRRRLKERLGEQADCTVVRHTFLTSSSSSSFFVLFNECNTYDRERSPS